MKAIIISSGVSVSSRALDSRVCVVTRSHASWMRWSVDESIVQFLYLVLCFPSLPQYVNCCQRYLLVRPSKWNLNPGPAATTARQRRYTSYNGTPFLAVHLLLFARVYDDYYVITGIFTPLVNAISLPPPQPRYDAWAHHQTISIHFPSIITDQFSVSSGVIIFALLHSSFN